MKFPMMFLKNEVITSLVVSVIATVIVLISVPRYRYIDEQDQPYDINRTWIAFKSFVITFIVFYLLLYFFATDPRSSLMSNMKQGEPEF